MHLLLAIVPGTKTNSSINKITEMQMKFCVSLERKQTLLTTRLKAYKQ